MTQLKWHLKFLIFTFFASTSLCKAQWEYKISDIMMKYKTVGLAVVVVKDGSIVYDSSFGFKNVETQTPLSTNDIFRIASISKSFSATAIMQLIARKKLSLDDDVSNLVGFQVRNPKFPSVPITLKMLLSHRSSINDSRGYFTLDSINPAITTHYTQCYNDYQPGSGYQYCNLNFNLVGAIIERISGERFDEYIRKHILNPLHLYGGYCVDSLNSSLFTTLYEYDRQNDTFIPSESAYASRATELQHYKIGYSTPIFSPTGGMKISASDLAKYMMMHMNYGKVGSTRIIPKKYSKLMQTPLSKESGYALAIMNYKDLVPGVSLTGHTGSAYGLFSSMFFNPEKKFGFVVITNGCDDTSTKGIVNVLRESLNVLYKEFIDKK